MTDLIRWEPNGYGGLLGYVGTLDDWMFQIWKPDDNGGEWVLQASAMAGRPGKPSFGDSPDELKPRAEELLREFAASIGAVFPEPTAQEAIEAAAKIIREQVLSKVVAGDTRALTLAVIDALAVASDAVRADERKRLADMLRARSDELRQIREVSAQLGAGTYEDAADLIEGKQ